MGDNKDVKYALSVGTILKNPKKRGPRSYTIFIYFELKDNKDGNAVKRGIGDIFLEMDVNTSVETVPITR